MKQSDEQALIDSASKLLDQSSEKVSLKVSMQLRKARMEAINAAKTQTEMTIIGPTLSMPRWIPSISMTTFFGGLILISILWWINPVQKQVQNTYELEDVQLLGDSNDIELYQNLDFYIWLSNEENIH